MLSRVRARFSRKPAPVVLPDALFAAKPTTVELPLWTVEAFIAAFEDGMLACHVAESLSCVEVEALANALEDSVYAVTGDASRASKAREIWIDSHADGD